MKRRQLLLLEDGLAYSFFPMQSGRHTGVCMG